MSVHDLNFERVRRLAVRHQAREEEQTRRGGTFVAHKIVSIPRYIN